MAPYQKSNVADADKMRKIFNVKPVIVVNDLPDFQLTGWASIEGTIKLIGDAPPRIRLRANKGGAVCAPGGKGPLKETLVVGDDGGIANVLFYLTDKRILTDDPKWIHPEYDKTKEATVDYDQKNCIFLSHVFAMRSTQTINIINSDSLEHNTKLLPRKAASFDQIIAGGGKTTHLFGAEEKLPFSVACNIHPWMTAYMITRDNPYFAVSDEKGHFEIKNLPAAEENFELEFTIWQEAATSLKSVKINGQQQKLNRGHYKIKLKPDDHLKLNIEIDLSSFKLR